jgi:hypothetical protein
VPTQTFLYCWLAEWVNMWALLTDEMDSGTCLILARIILEAGRSCSTEQALLMTQSEVGVIQGNFTGRCRESRLSTKELTYELPNFPISSKGHNNPISRSRGSPCVSRHQNIFKGIEDAIRERTSGRRGCQV